MPHDTDATEFGLTEGFSLTEACADFYLLERLRADGRHEREFDDFCRHLSREFLNYVEYACWTEIGYVHQLQYSSTTGECSVIDDACEECGCSSYDVDEGYCECHYNPYDAPLKWPQSVKKHYVAYLEAHKKSKSWDKRIKVHFDYREKHGRHVWLDQAHHVFLDGKWSGGYGGKPWASIARVGRDFSTGLMKPSTFIDRCWTLQHNGGCFFDKTSYSGYYDIMKVLEVQASEDYDKLAKKWASGKTERLWRNHKLLSRSHHDPVWLGVQLDVIIEGGDDE